MTRIQVETAPGRARLGLTGGRLSPRLLRVTATGARVGLVATTALLLAEDHIEIDIVVGAGAWLEVVETAGTVAYDAGGVASSWTVRISVADGAVLLWAGEPFVVSDGANVRRQTAVDLAGTGIACLRETVVLGRSGEVGGALASTLSVRLDGCDLLREDLDLTEPVGRSLPGIIGRARVVDSLMLLGMRAPSEPATAAGHRFDLDGQGTVLRSLTTSFADSTVGIVNTAWQAAALGRSSAPQLRSGHEEGRATMTG